MGAWLTGLRRAAGWEQGGVVAMQAALLLEERVAGVVALSTWLGQPPKLAGAAKAGLPLLVCHGAVDRFVPPRFGREAKETLNRLGLATIFKMYPMMGHAFCAQVPSLAPPRPAKP